MLLNAKKKGRDKMIKTFRGMLQDGTQDRIRLSTIQGKVGYQITKMQIMPYDPTGDVLEVVIKIYKESQSSIDDKIDFTDSKLLAAAYIENHDDPSAAFGDFTSAVIFDNEIINQDIYITSAADSASSGVSYYLELEIIPLTELGAEYTTVKDLRVNA